MADDMGIRGGFQCLSESKPIKGNRAGFKNSKDTKYRKKFAKQGMIFTDAHAPASMCSSTRYSLLDRTAIAHRSYLKKQGWLPHGPNRSMIQRDLVTLPEMLQQNDYFMLGVVVKNIMWVWTSTMGMVTQQMNLIIRM